MFARNIFNKIISLNRNCSSHAAKSTPSIKFGNINMPDKLYKNIEIEMRSSDRAVMKSYTKFVTTAARHLQLKVSQVLDQKKPSLRRFTLLKSAFVHRKHLVQYEIRTHYTWIYLDRLTGSTADTFLEYIQRMLPEGVALKVTRVAVEPIPDHLNKIKFNDIKQEKSGDHEGLSEDKNFINNSELKNNSPNPT